jgi:hypothetical protein
VLLILSRSICASAQFAFLSVEPKTNEAEDAPIGNSPVGGLVAQEVDEVEGETDQRNIEN